MQLRLGASRSPSYSCLNRSGHPGALGLWSCDLALSSRQAETASARQTGRTGDEESASGLETSDQGAFAIILLGPLQDVCVASCSLSTGVSRAPNLARHRGVPNGSCYGCCLGVIGHRAVCSGGGGPRTDTSCRVEVVICVQLSGHWIRLANTWVFHYWRQSATSTKYRRSECMPSHHTLTRPRPDVHILGLRAAPLACGTTTSLTELQRARRLLASTSGLVTSKYGIAVLFLQLGASNTPGIAALEQVRCIGTNAVPSRYLYAHTPTCMYMCAERERKMQDALAM